MAERRELAIEDPAEIVATLEALTAGYEGAVNRVAELHVLLEEWQGASWLSRLSLAPRLVRRSLATYRALLDDLETLRALSARLLRAFQDQTVMVRVREPGIIVPPPRGA